MPVLKGEWARGQDSLPHQGGPHSPWTFPTSIPMLKPVPAAGVLPLSTSPVEGSAQILSSMELSPEPLSFQIPIALTGDSVPSSRACFSLPALPGFQAFSCTCHVVRLVADSLKCKLHLSLSCQGCGLKECWISVGEPSARETPNHSPLCKIPRRDTGTQNLSS